MEREQAVRLTQNLLRKMVERSGSDLFITHGFPPAIKVDGTAKFAMDVYLPNQMIALIARPEQRGGVAVSFDDTAAQSVKGYIRSAVLPNKAGVAVYAENTWAAIQASRPA